MNKLALLAGAAAVAASAHANAAWYTSEADFLSAINPDFYLEDFNGWVYGSPLNGSQTTWNAPGANGYGWTASASLGLWSNDGSLSTNNAGDPITITFTGAPVTAFGGIFTGTDINGNVIPATVVITLSNGEQQQLINPTSSTFLGWTGNVAITSITIDAPGVGVNDWPAVDHFYVGSAAIPAPGALAALALGLVGCGRRRRQA